MSKYYVYDFLIGSPVLIDAEKSRIIFFRENIWGEIYNLDSITDDDIMNVTKRTINGLITRTYNDNYFYNKRVVDSYIYNFLMNEEEKNKVNECNIDLLSLNDKEYLYHGNNIDDVLYNMAKITLKNEGNKEDIDKNQKYLDKVQKELIKECKKILDN